MPGTKVYLNQLDIDYIRAPTKENVCFSMEMIIKMLSFVIIKLE